MQFDDDSWAANGSAPRDQMTSAELACLELIELAVTDELLQRIESTLDREAPTDDREAPTDRLSSESFTAISLEVQETVFSVMQEEQRRSINDDDREFIKTT